MPGVIAQKKMTSLEKNDSGASVAVEAMGKWVPTVLEWSVNNTEGSTSKKKVTAIVEDISVIPVSRTFLVVDSISRGKTKKGTLNIPFQSGSVCIIYEDDGSLCATDRSEAITGLYINSVDIGWGPQSGGGPDAWDLGAGGSQI